LSNNQEDAFVKSPPRLAKKLALLVVACVLAVISCELFCHTWFWHFLRPDVRDNALYVVGRSADVEGEATEPKIRPYLWSNFAPYPSTSHANALGWRYGGGKRTSKLRILCLGGSTTWGNAATSPEKSYPAQMETFLKSKGFSVDVVNGGCDGHSTAEMIGTLAFRGIYENPDMVIIHEGINDSGPLFTQANYRPDYTNWRTVDEQHMDGSAWLLRKTWRIPSWTVRAFSAALLRPNPFNYEKVGYEMDPLDDPRLLSQTDFSKRVNAGFKANLATLSAIARAHGATPVFMTVVFLPNKVVQWLPDMKTDRDFSDRIQSQAKWGIDHNNGLMETAGRELNNDVIPFDKWRPTKDEYWVDPCHLNDAGEGEKASFVGEWLIARGYLAKANLDGDVETDRTDEQGDHKKAASK
jgi:lysophospholipase L1-like esterase